MPAATTTENVSQKTDEKVKSAEQIDLEEAETAITGKDYKTARPLLEKLGKIYSRVSIDMLTRFFSISQTPSERGR